MCHQEKRKMERTGNNLNNMSYIQLFTLILNMAILSIASYNSNGFAIDRMKIIDELSKTHTFTLIQEHWLLPNQLDKISDIPNICHHGISGMPGGSLLTGRPYGGCAIIWSDTFKGKVEPVMLQSTRVCAVVISFGTKHILLANVYMPVDTISNRQNFEEYNTILHEIINLCEHSNFSDVIVGGDFNTDTSRLDSLHTKALLDILDQGLYVSWLTCSQHSVDYLYESKINGSRSLIDHFIISKEMSKSVISAKVIHNGANLSDHDAISISLDLHVEYLTQNKPTVPNISVLWDKVSKLDIEKYKCELDIQLKNISCFDDVDACGDMNCKDVGHILSIDDISRKLIDACLSAASQTLPQNEPNRKAKTCVPGWSKIVEPCKKDALFWHAVWQSCGSPRYGVVAGIRKRTRAIYHKAIKQCKKDKDLHTSNSIASAFCDKNYKSFWESVKKLSKYKTNTPSSIDNANGSDEISQLFACKYDDLYNYVPYCDRKMELINNELNSLVETKCQLGKCGYSHKISYADVKAAIDLLKSNKSDGDLGLNSNHLLMGTEVLFVMIAKLTTSMLHHGYAAPNLRLSTIIPIVKNKQASMNDSSNYRGVALSSSIAKLMDIIIIRSHSKALKTSDFQFGFKVKSSTVQCTFVFDEIVNYYTKSEGNVYATLLDASKAFDHVQYEQLFRLIIDRNVCASVARLLAFMYTNQSCRIKWSSSISSTFSVNNGVKQGGVLSPLLFNIYIDVLLKRLEENHV